MDKARLDAIKLKLNVLWCTIITVLSMFYWFIRIKLKNKFGGE